MHPIDILNDPSTSNWLKAAIRESSSRDPIDVLNDLDVLYKMTEERIGNIQKHFEQRLNDA